MLHQAKPASTQYDHTHIIRVYDHNLTDCKLESLQKKGTGEEAICEKIVLSCGLSTNPDQETMHLKMLIAFVTGLPWNLGN